MITQDHLDADKQAVAAAQAQLDADQAAFDAIAPHVSTLAYIESYAVNLPAEFAVLFKELLSKVRAAL